MIKFLREFFALTEKQLMEEHVNFYDIILDLQDRVEKLEEENIELTNSLYEIENRIQAKIDNIHPVTYNLSNYTLDK